MVEDIVEVTVVVAIEEVEVDTAVVEVAVIEEDILTIFEGITIGNSCNNNNHE